MTPDDPPILMHNPFLHKKWGCLQKKLEIDIFKTKGAMAILSLKKIFQMFSLDFRNIFCSGN